MFITLHMSASLNGFIARPNDDTDFLAHDNWVIFVELARRTGAAIWGRKTHEVVRSYGPQFFQELAGLPCVVLSRDPQFPVEPGFLVATTPGQALERLRQAGCTQALLVGGADVNTAFVDAGLVDTVILNFQAVLVGEGIPLFAPAAFDLPLQLEAIERIRPDIVQLRYQVRK
jgi:dihydrofolate reductase